MPRMVLNASEVPQTVSPSPSVGILWESASFVSSHVSLLEVESNIVSSVPGSSAMVIDSSEGAVLINCAPTIFLSLSSAFEADLVIPSGATLAIGHVFAGVVAGSVVLEGDVLVEGSLHALAASSITFDGDVTLSDGLFSIPEGCETVSLAGEYVASIASTFAVDALMDLNLSGIFTMPGTSLAVTAVNTNAMGFFEFFALDVVNLVLDYDVEFSVESHLIATYVTSSGTPNIDFTCTFPLESPCSIMFQDGGAFEDEARFKNALLMLDGSTALGSSY